MGAGEQDARGTYIGATSDGSKVYVSKAYTGTANEELKVGYSTPITPIIEYVYLYQIFCPNCDIVQYIPINTKWPCNGCSKILLAHDQDVDFHVKVKN